ncbi:MAG: hypothetical protein V1926_01720 [Candidatus Peregrinibacteria bacterium]
MKHTLLFRAISSILLSGALLVIPTMTAAYLIPEDVLLRSDLALPPTTREAGDRTLQQSEVSAERREAIQAAEFARQHPAPPEVPEEKAPETETMEMSATDRQLLSTLRLLGRVSNQQQVLYLNAHAGAPIGGQPLSSTGAGGILTAIVMLGAVSWTMLRAKRWQVYAKKPE